eukprot:15480002-Alexandrium_andersonii.AAC.1
MLVENAKSLQACEPGNARAQERPQKGSPELPRGAFCAVLRAEADGNDEIGWRSRRRRFSE